MDRPGKHRGVTAIELLVTIAIAAVLMALAIPSYRYVTTSNRMSAEINQLLGDMQFARYEAIKEGVPVTVCPSNDGMTCSLVAPWNDGWIVQSSSNDTVLRYEPAFTSGDTVSVDAAVQSIAFNREGFASGLSAVGILTLSLHDSTDSSAYTRCLVIGMSGLLTTQTYGPSTVTGVTCT